MATYAIGDVHACFDQFITLKNRIEAKDPEATFILMGDAIGKGPQDLEMLEWLKAHITPSGKYQMILGNHDDNFIEVFGRGQFETLAKHTKTDDKEFAHLPNRPDEMFEYAKFLASQPLSKVLTVQGKSYVLAHGWYGPDRKTLLTGRKISKDGHVLEHFQGEGKLLLGHTPTSGKFPPPAGMETGKVWDFGTEAYLDCGLVFNILGQAPLGNLAAYTLETGEIHYLWP